MKFGANRGQLDDAQQTARAAWQAATEWWDDSTRREHEAEVFAPLDDRVGQVLRAVDQLIVLFAAARRECEFQPY